MNSIKYVNVFLLGCFYSGDFGIKNYNNSDQILQMNMRPAVSPVQ